MNDRKQNGFTLIEIIIALVVFSILAVMIISFSVNISPSASSVITLSRSADLQRGMDNVTRAFYYYYTPPITHANLDTFKTNLTTNTNIINVAGISVDAGRTKFIKFDATNTEVPDASANGDCCPNGSCCPSGCPPGAPASCLKVTLVNSEGQSVSTIFTTR